LAWQAHQYINADAQRQCIILQEVVPLVCGLNFTMLQAAVAEEPQLSTGLKDNVDMWGTSTQHSHVQDCAWLY